MWVHVFIVKYERFTRWQVYRTLLRANRTLSTLYDENDREQPKSIKRADAVKAVSYRGAWRARSFSILKIARAAFMVAKRHAVRSDG